MVVQEPKIYYEFRLSIFACTKNGWAISIGDKMRPIIHGDDCRGKRKRLYNIWVKMKHRCNDKNLENYGKRGISVCSEWSNSYTLFKKWAEENGYSDELTIDRIDNSGNYSPENCRWSTVNVQNRNKRNVKLVTIFGETKSIPEWAEDSRCSVSFRTLRARISEYHWDVETAILKP